MKFRKRPVVIEAIQWTGENWAEVYDFIYGPGQQPTGHSCSPDDLLTIKTLEGDMTASINDWIIRGVAGEFYPVKDSIFQLTYEAVDDSERS